MLKMWKKYYLEFQEIIGNIEAFTAFSVVLSVLVNPKLCNVYNMYTTRWRSL